jgi:peroxiredoxin Q/BCP
MFEGLFSRPLPVESPAPDFTLQDQEGNQVTLSRLLGRNVVLVFYPGDDTMVCTRQLCEFRDQWNGAESRNTVVYGVNPAGAESHRQFRGKYRLPFPLLVDTGRKVAKLYRCSGLIVKRTVYLIGPDGLIRYAVRGKPQVSKVLEAAFVN